MKEILRRSLYEDSMYEGSPYEVPLFIEEFLTS
jgi:hypothetical protein